MECGSTRIKLMIYLFKNLHSLIHYTQNTSHPPQLFKVTHDINNDTKSEVEEVTKQVVK